MEHPEDEVPLTPGHKDAQPIGKNGDFDAHGDWAIEHGSHVEMLHTISMRLKRIQADELTYRIGDMDFSWIFH